MKVVILAGGFGTRLEEETYLKPKPMVEIGGKPILWHIMKIFDYYGYQEFVICLGYKGYVIKEFFYNYFLHQSDVTIDTKNNKLTIHDNKCEPWKVSLIDTGPETMTGGRIKRIQEYVENDVFIMTYGDGLGDINIKALLAYHKEHGKYATMTTVQPFGRFGAVDIDKDDTVVEFQEKRRGDSMWINGGFFVLSPKIFDYIDADSTIWERSPLETLTKERQLAAYRHNGFWMCMDTLRDKKELEKLWQSEKPPWKIWKD